MTSCNGPSRSNIIASNSPTVKIPIQAGKQIGDYIVEIFEDSKGNLWFGTLGNGVAFYDGETLNYFTMKDGLVGNTVVSMVEDKEGILWFGTHSGLSKYDGKTFVNFTSNEGEEHNRIANILIDKSGVFWVGTWGGIYQFDNGKFSNFPIPIPTIELLPYQTTMHWTTEIFEDKQGNIWFGRDGYGACKYDGNTFTHFTKKDGLPSNNVSDIQDDNQGNIWFSTRIAERDHPDPDKRIGEGGLVRYDGQKTFQYPTLKGLSKSDVYSIYEDKTGHIWVGTIGDGVYKYDGKKFTNFNVDKSLDFSNKGIPFKGVTNILEDKNGKLWFGCAGGLFRLGGLGVINITQNGPW